MEVGSYFLSFTALVPFTVMIAEAVIRLFKLSTDLGKQITAGVVAVILCFIGMWLDLGLFKDFGVLATVAYAVPTALAAMGLATIEKAKLLLDVIMNFLKLAKEPK